MWCTQIVQGRPSQLQHCIQLMISQCWVVVDHLLQKQQGFVVHQPPAYVNSVGTPVYILFSMTALHG